MPRDFELDPILATEPDNDGAVTLTSGYEVLGRILAQHGPVKYTKALRDSGDIPEGTVIDNLTGPIQEAGEGMIAKVENTGTGEATVTVQASSIGVAVGFRRAAIAFFAAVKMCAAMRAFLVWCRHVVLLLDNQPPEAVGA